MTVHLTYEQVVRGAEVILGPTCVIRDPGLLASAIARPAMTVFGQDPYPSLDLKAAALLHSLVANHPFADGNKRMGWASVVVFYRLNARVHAGHDMDDEAFTLVMDVAKGLDDVPTIADRLAPMFS